MIGFSRLGRRLRNALAADWPAKVPAWTVVAFCAVYLIAFLPCVVYVVGIHNDYEMIWFKTWSLFHSEAPAMVALGRPVAALLTNLTMLPVSEVADFRWVRFFSIATVWVTGVQLLIVCICHLAVRPRDALAISLAIFLVPSFMYSVLAAAAWAPHLVTIFFALWSYASLSRSNVQAAGIYDLFGRRNFRDLVPQAVAYACLRPVVLACILLQVALYDYPPQAMILACLPIVTLLFSGHVHAYRIILAVRDVVFIAANLLIYGVTAKLLYIPIVRRIVDIFSDEWLRGDRTTFDLRIAESYRYALNFDLSEMFRRLFSMLKVSGDLWFLPQFNVHAYVAALVGMAVVLAVARSIRRERPTAPSTWECWYIYGAVLLTTVAACFVLAGSAVLSASGGFVSYRTIAMPIAVACVVALFAIRYLGRLAGTIAGMAPAKTVILGDLAILGLVAAAAAAIFYDNYLTMRLARNEHAYFAQMIRQVKASGVTNIVLADPRPFSLPEDNPAISDQDGRSVPPYEMGCFSGYCLQTDAILRVTARELGIDPHRLTIWVLRANQTGPAITCDLLRSRSGSYPQGASEKDRQTIDSVRTAGDGACFTYDLAWHDVGVDLSANRRPVGMVRLKGE